MDIDYIKNNYVFETLTRKHDLSKFDCKSNDLNEFLKKDALKQQNEKLNVTKLIIYDGEIIGYISLLTDSIKIDKIQEKETSASIIDVIPGVKSAPAIKIGRFAIDKKYSNKGLGTDILISAVKNITKLSEEKIGIRFITVDAYAKAYTFYVNKHHFKNIKRDEDKLKKIEKIIEKNPEQTFFLYKDILKQ